MAIPVANSVPSCGVRSKILHVEAFALVYVYSLYTKLYKFEI